MHRHPKTHSVHAKYSVRYTAENSLKMHSHTHACTHAHAHTPYAHKLLSSWGVHESNEDAAEFMGVHESNKDAAEFMGVHESNEDAAEFMGVHESNEDVSRSHVTTTMHTES